MTVFRYDELATAEPAPGNIRRQAYSDNLMMVIVDFVGGPSAPQPHHSHPHEQISYVAQGPLNFYLGQGGEQTITRVETGDLVVIPPNLPHTVEPLAEETRLVDAFHPIRQEFL